MPKVQNRKVIAHLALRELKANRRMNAVVILSIILTCVLFTALTTVGGSLMNGGQQETMRMVGGDRMAGLKYVLPEDYEKVLSDSAVRDVTYRIIVGDAVGSDLKDIAVEVNCAGDIETAKALFCNPEVGRLPEELDEIAVSTIVLDAMSLPHELGIPVPVTLDVDGERTQHTFILCGFWEGEHVAMAQECWVSRSFADTYAPTPGESFYTQESPGYAGYWQVDFNFANSWDIEGKTQALLSRIYGEGDVIPETGINWAYTTSSVDGGTLTVGIALLFVVFAAGYLIIFNIFHINIAANIRSFGLLKTIGTTSRQIRRMVRTQAAVYCAVGIPIGLIVGVLLGKMLIRSILRILNIYSKRSYAISSGFLGLICVIAAVFTFMTVMISCRRPCKIAGGVSPIEALRYNEAERHGRGKGKKSRKITPRTIALGNLSRTRKKAAVVVLSLSLSLLLVNTLFVVLDGIDEDKFIGNSIVGDILVRHTEKTDLWEDRVKGITPGMISDLEEIDGAQVHPVYYDQGWVLPDGKVSERLDKLHERYAGNDKLEPELQNALDEGYIADVYGIDEGAAAFFEPMEGSIDLQKLLTGRYAIVHTYLWQADDDPDVEIYHVGDTISIEGGDGKVHEYEVMAVCGVPYPLSTKVYSLLMTQVILPAKEYLAITEAPGASSVMINMSEDSNRVKDVCRAYCDRDGSVLVYSDKQTYLDQFEDFLKMVGLLGGTLASLLALIGILNFINAVVTGILSRKRELAMMNAVGMTGKQLKSMLMWEGIQYSLLTAGCSLALGAVLNHAVVNSIAGELFFFTYHFTLLPILVCVPVLLLLSAAIPSVSYQMICKDSIVNRLRENG